MALALAAAATQRESILQSAGLYLVEAQANPSAADAILVLAGDASGNRILKGKELLDAGLAPRVFVSGPRGFYGHSESDLALAFLARRGVATERFEAVPNQCNSTRDEATVFTKLFRERGVKSFILVTSNYHTRRASAVFRKAAEPAGLRFVTVAAPDTDFDPRSWWKSRQGRKAWLYEAMKTAAEWLGA
jgi:uncharacterized SAM-binding protein YcdF (DUF218 family)